jgi:predicted amidohydrolase
MKICVAQIKPVKGDIPRNIDSHKKLIEVAVCHQTDLIVFPELSITGYEPGLAKELTTDKDDTRFDVFQKASDDNRMTICIGAPVKNQDGITISMIIFQPKKPRQVYAKQYLHPDELPYFTNGQGQIILEIDDARIAPAICYELSVPAHAENAYRQNANIYIASVAKSVEGIAKAHTALSSIARHYSMTVLVSNCIGNCDGVECGGQSAIWDDHGIQLAQLNQSTEGIVILDTHTGQPIVAPVITAGSVIKS